MGNTHSSKICLSAVFVLLLAFLAACGDDTSSATDIYGSKGDHSRSSSSRSVKVSKANDEEEDKSSSSSAECVDDDEREYGYIGFMNDAKFNEIENKEVHIWALAEDGLELVKTDTLDCKNMIKIDTSLSGFYLVEMNLEYNAAMRWIDFKKDMKTQIYMADYPVELTGYIKEMGIGINKAKIRVLDIEMETQHDGYFSFEYVPDGVHYMTVEYDGETRVYQVPTTTRIGYSDKPVVNQIHWEYGEYMMLDDFEDWSSGRTVPANTFWLGGYRYFGTDATNGGGSRFKGEGGFADEDKFRYDDMMGYCLYLNVDIDEETENHYAVAGFTLGKGSTDNDEGFRYYDISDAKSLSFDAKGSGSLSIQFKNNHSGSPDYVTSEILELDTAWSSYSYPFAPARSMLTAVEAINFIIEEDAEIFIDNVRLDGIKPTSWLSHGRQGL